MSLATDRGSVAMQEKQRATEIAIEEMSERVDFLEAENRQLQKTLEDATHTVKVLACSLLVLPIQGRHSRHIRTRRAARPASLRCCVAHI